MPWVDAEEETGQKYLAPSTGGWVDAEEGAIPFEKSKSNYTEPKEEVPEYDKLLAESGPRILPMLKNLPKSALDVGVGVVKAISNIPATAKALGQTVAGGIEKLTGSGTGEHIPNWDAFSGFMKDRYGSLGNLYKTMETDPAGFMTDVSTVLGGAGAVSRSGMLARAGKATNLLYGGAKYGGTALGKAEDLVVGALSGSTTRTVNKARQWSGDFQDLMRGKVTGQQLVGGVRNSLDELATKASREYAASLSEIDNLGVTVNPAGVYNKFDELLKSIRVTRDESGKLVYDGSNLELQKPMQTELNKIDTYLRARTINGSSYEMIPSEVDAMKKWIWEEQRKIDPNRNAPVKNLAKQLYGATKQVLEEQIPEYKDMTSKYRKYVEWQDEFEKAFSLGDKTSIETTIGKFRTAAKIDKEFRQQLTKDYKDLTGKDLEAMIAGYDMKDIMPRGLWGRSMATATGVGAYNIDPRLWAVFPFTLPRVAGEMMQIQGLGAKYLKKLPSQTPNVLYESGRVRDKSKPKSVLYGGE